MSETPSASLTATDRNHLFDTWLKPVTPAKARVATVVEQLAPWRRQFTDAIAAGYTWQQLATEIASKSEIGIKISAGHLKNSIYAAYKAAGETTPGQPKAKRRHKRTRSTPPVVDPATPASATP